MTHPSDIVGYTYKAENYSPAEIIQFAPELAQALGSGDAEEVLTFWADMLSNGEFDRSDEYSFDSNDFPKVVLRGQLDCDRNEDDRRLCGAHEASVETFGDAVDVRWREAF